MPKANLWVSKFLTLPRTHANIIAPQKKKMSSEHYVEKKKS